jgi:threonine dehydratase
MAEAASFQDVQEAAERLRGQVIETPLLNFHSLDEAVGARVFVKAESLQRTGSFKFRGAYNRLSRLTTEERKAGVVAFSSGNHAQGVALAAQLLRMPAVIVMPSDAPDVKIEATRGYGAVVVFYDRFEQSREEISAGIAEERGAVLVPSFDDPFIIAGQGTVALEAIGQLEAHGARADAALCGVSGGGLMAGVALAFEALSPETKLYAVEPEGYDDHALSLAAGERVAVKPPGPSVSDSLLSAMPGELTFPIDKRLLAGALAVSDEEALMAVAFAAQRMKLVLEPGGAVSLAALLTGKLDVQGRTVLLVASGGNIEPRLMIRALRPPQLPVE